jgi:hypothetical protein
MPALRLLISGNPRRSNICSLSATADQSTAVCRTAWLNLKEKLRDVLRLEDSDLIRMESELVSTGATQIESVEASPARLRALGLEWPVR